MSQEIERKFLVNETWQPAGWRMSYIQQGYLKNEADLQIRIRIVSYGGWGGWERDCTLTFKTPARGLVRTEIETVLKEDDAFTLMKLCQTQMKKTRYRAIVEGSLWEVDKFEDGRLVAEIELATPDQEFFRPTWLGEEVTGNPMFSNDVIAERIPELTINATYNITGRGTLHEVTLTQDLDEDIVGKTVFLNGKLFEVRGIERAGYGLRKGSKIGLLGRFVVHTGEIPDGT